MPKETKDLYSETIICWWKKLNITQTNEKIYHVLRLKGFSSVQFSRSVVSDSMRPHELQHARPPCPSPTPQGLSKVFSSTTVRKHQFFGTQPSLWSVLTSLPDYWINHNFDYLDLHTSVYFGEAGLPALSMFWAEQLSIIKEPEQLYIFKEHVPICEII